MEESARDIPPRDIVVQTAYGRRCNGKKQIKDTKHTGSHVSSATYQKSILFHLLA